MALDNRDTTVGVFIDLAKVFVSVSHSLLLEKLGNYGFRNNAYNLLKTFLEQRKQHVAVDGVASETKKITFGVPQGTISGPILFIMYMKDLYNLNTVGKIVTFADDTVIIYKENRWQDLKYKIEVDFKIVENWLDYNL